MSPTNPGISHVRSSRCVSQTSELPITIKPAVPPAPIRPNRRFAPRMAKSSDVTTQKPEVRSTVPKAVQM